MEGMWETVTKEKLSVDHDDKTTRLCLSSREKY